MAIVPNLPECPPYRATSCLGEQSRKGIQDASNRIWNGRDEESSIDSGDRDGDLFSPHVHALNTADLDVTS